MASHDYYNSNPYDRTNAPLPPPPGAGGDLSMQPLSPVPSSLDDRSRYEYNTSSTAPSAYTSQQHLAKNPEPFAGYEDTSYHGASEHNAHGAYQSGSHANSAYQSNSHLGNDPFTDQNAIPLRQQGKQDERYSPDPEGHVYQPEPVSRKKKGWFSGRITWVVYILSIVQIGVFVGELIQNATLTKSPIQTKPQFNIMIGPSPYVLINMGARYPPCMHNIRGVTDNTTEITWPCPNTISNPTGPNGQWPCTLSELCGMGGVPEQKYPTDFTDRSREPNQWWRFIVPIFLHAGIIHIGFNLLLQLTLGRDMEKEIGPFRFALVYFSAGIFGFVLGGNYAAPNIPSVGASGSLFGILALVLLDLLYNWSSRPSPVKDLLFLLLDIGIAFVLGLLPGLDNFSHIGGFLMGLVLGICLLHSPAALRERIGVDEPPYATVDTAEADTAPLAGHGGKSAAMAWVAKPVGFFKGRKPLWWAWWLVRAGALIAVLIGFILLLRNFYEWRQECSWCYRLTCLPVKNWCNIGQF